MGWLRAMVCVVAAACSPPHRDAPGDGAPDAPAPLCGNGVNDSNSVPEDASWPESCDDGPLNGTSQSLCTKQCQSARITSLIPLVSVPLGRTATRIVPVSVPVGSSTAAGIAFTSYDDTGIHVIWNMSPVYAMGVTPPITDLKVASAPVALGVTPNPQAPLWVEGPTTADPTLHLYKADLDANMQPVVHEIPYPFSDGTRPQIFVGGYGFSIIDQSNAPPYDLLVAEWSTLEGFPADTPVATARLAAPGRLRGVAVPTQAPDLVEQDWHDVTINFVRIVQFFEDSSTYVTIEIQEPGPVAVDPTAYTISQFAVGTFPHHVTSGRLFEKGWSACVMLGQNAAPYRPSYAALTHPTPILVLTETGELYSFQPSSDPNGEAAVQVFARVAPGSFLASDDYENLDNAGWTWPFRAWVIEPDGTNVYLADSDCTNPTAPSLAPQRFPMVSPTWTTSATQVGETNANGQWGIVLDDRFWTTGL